MYSTKYNYLCVAYFLPAWNKQTYKVNHIRFLDLFHSVYLSIRRIIMLLLSSMSCVWIQNPVIFGIILTNSEGSVHCEVIQLVLYIFDVVSIMTNLCYKKCFLYQTENKVNHCVNHLINKDPWRLLQLVILFHWKDIELDFKLSLCHRKEKIWKKTHIFGANFVLMQWR